MEALSGSLSSLILLLVLLFIVRMIFDFFVPFAIFRIRRDVIKIERRLNELKL